MAKTGIEVTGLDETVKAYQDKPVEKAQKKPFADLILKIDQVAKVSTVVDTGRLRSSITHELLGEMSGIVGTNVVYACVVGSRHPVYEPMTGSAMNIGNYSHASVLSKDGNPHNIEKKHRFYRNDISAISITTRHGRNPLIVTDDHLILILRDGNIIWEEAKALRQSDMVMGKRSHNAITDKSNKKSFLCFCGQVFWVTKDILPFRGPKYCSSECRHKYGPHDQNTGQRWALTEEQKIQKRGENNPQWRDGSSLLPYDYNFNGKLKMLVKERDGFQCQECRSPFDLVVHHKDWNKMNSSIDNLITLCRQCHGKQQRQDCELPEVNLSSFVPKSIMELAPIVYRQNGRVGVPHLYDFSVENENSYMVGGMLIHNSFVEFGTSKMQARHMDGGRVLGTGMFEHTISKLDSELSDYGVSVVNNIKKELEE